MKDDFRRTKNGFEYDYPGAAMTADCIIFGFDGQDLNVLLIKRGVEPYNVSLSKLTSKPIV